jgi:hypothetical protein
MPVATHGQVPSNSKKLHNVCDDTMALDLEVA